MSEKKPTRPLFASVPPLLSSRLPPSARPFTNSGSATAAGADAAARAAPSRVVTKNLRDIEGPSSMVENWGRVVADVRPLVLAAAAQNYARRRLRRDYADVNS